MRFFVIVLPLAPLTVESGFRRDSWPDHVTLIPPFQTTAHAELVLEAIRAAAADHAVIVTRAEGHARFGRRRDVPVTTLELTPELEALHVALLEVIDGFLPHGTRLSHVGPRGYRPHVAQREDSPELRPGASVTLDQLAVIDMRPHGDARHRSVVATVPLRRLPA